MKLIFVYNSNGTFASLIKDTAHKLASPETYQCNLCRLTYPFATMDKKWKDFIASLPYESAFLHRDEFHEQYPNQKNTKLPTVLAEDNSSLRELISADEINKAKNVSELIKIVERALPKQNDKRVLHQCPECGLKYDDEQTAKKCEAWCREHKSCNLDIIKYAVKENGTASKK